MCVEDYGVRFDTEVNPYERTRKLKNSRITAFTAFVDKLKYSKMEYKNLSSSGIIKIKIIISNKSEIDRQTCDNLIKLTDKNGRTTGFYEGHGYSGYKGSTRSNKLRSESQEPNSSPYEAVYNDGAETGFSDAIKMMSKSPKSETVPKRYKKEPSNDGSVSILDSPQKSSMKKSSSVGRFQHQQKGQLLQGAPLEYIDAEDAYKIKTQTEFPNTPFGNLKNFVSMIKLFVAAKDLEKKWRDQRSDQKVKETWTTAAYQHNLAVKNSE